MSCIPPQVALLCVSQIIPVLAAKEREGVYPFQEEQQKAAAEQKQLNGSSPHATKEQQSWTNDGRQLLEETASAPDGDKQKFESVSAALTVLSPLLISCMDDDWNADVRLLTIKVVWQLFEDLEVRLHFAPESIRYLLPAASD